MTCLAHKKATTTTAKMTRMKAEAMSEFGKAALMNMLLETMPQLAKEIAAPC